jgi:general nucleoside transport system ATP-binding protein
MEAILEARGVGKIYPGGIIANDGVDLQIKPGEVHAVVGENGAGKSTLMKMLFGIEQPTSGQLLLHGKPVKFASPKEAIDAGVGMVFQHFSLVPSFTVYENVVMGAEPRAGAKFDRRQAIEDVRALSTKYQLNVDPCKRVKELPVGQQQRVEILKALYRDAKILILDEPTAVLAPQEVQELFVAIRSFVDTGRTVIFIAHKLPEVLQFSDVITVLRHGKTVGHVRANSVSESDLASMLVGREVILRVDRAPIVESQLVANCTRLTARERNGSEVLRGVDLNIHAGEIVGLVGVEGNGQSELLEIFSGLRTATAGRVSLGGRDITRSSVLERRGRGLASIPADRLAEGLAAEVSICENIAATRLRSRRFARRGFLNLKAIKEEANELIEKFSIRSSGPAAAVGSLSGGNMQKVVVARELAEQPKLLLVNQPTRGVDLGATQFIWRTITEARDTGTAILLASTDLSEVMALSDRLLVFYHGRIVAAFQNSPELTQEMLGRFMLGLDTQSPDEMKRGMR